MCTSIVGRSQMLQLYRQLLRYGRTLKYTDKNYYYGRIRAEFEKHRDVDPKAQLFHYKWQFSKQFNFNLICRLKSTLDRSKFPVINEEDLEEQFVRGWGPGGQKVNKTASCVQLKHVPTGVIVKCQETRYQVQNRKIARAMLLEKLDEVLNGEMSVKAQIHRIEKEKNVKLDAKAKRLRERKREFLQARLNNSTVDQNEDNFRDENSLDESKKV